MNNDIINYKYFCRESISTPARGLGPLTVRAILCEYRAWWPLNEIVPLSISALSLWY